MSDPNYFTTPFHQFDPFEYNDLESIFPIALKLTKDLALFDYKFDRWEWKLQSVGKILHSISRELDCFKQGSSSKSTHKRRVKVKNEHKRKISIININIIIIIVM